MYRKIKLLITFLLMVSVQSVFSQTSFKDYFNEDTPLTYLGVDFTQAKVNGLTKPELEDLIERHFSSINNLVLNEPDKYKLEKFFHKYEVKTDIDQVEEHNKKIEVDNLKADGEPKELAKNDLEKLIKGYNFSGKKGMGVIFVMEYMNKVEKSEKAVLHVVFIDMEKSKVLFSERYTTKPAGFGVRNYWAKSVYNVMDKIGDTDYKRWKKNNG